ncbi:MAG: UDP-N-acetylmuramate dehydrogenase [Bacteroidales bacterium]|jgi:UDP-N-acetylmuramate dehydrogenase|nr:UDP-N-acetylmuramate dehydrogenase [Bacteroidales bacterium]
MITFYRHTSLLSRNTFAVPATADTFVVSDDVAELTRELHQLHRKNLLPRSMLVLGGGSNILFVSDPCWVVHPDFKGIEMEEEDEKTVRVRVYAGETWDDVVKWCVEHNYSGMENLSAIPGTVGACPVQNIGAYGQEAKDVIEQVEVFDIAAGKTCFFSRSDCAFSYRDSFFKHHRGEYLIVSVSFRLAKIFTPQLSYAGLQEEIGNRPVTLSTVREAVINIRQRKLPDYTILGNAGSFFKNPSVPVRQACLLQQRHASLPLYPAAEGYRKVSAAWLIEQCGWKGVKKGNVGAYSSQPLILVNYGNASGKEIMDFANEIMDSVEKKFDIRLETEVHPM